MVYRRETGRSISKIPCELRQDPNACDHYYEVYKVLKREISEEKALLAVGYMKKSQVILFDDNIALAAADISLHEKLAMADAIIVATAQAHNCEIISADIDLKEQATVQYLSKL